MNKNKKTRNSAKVAKKGSYSMQTWLLFSTSFVVIILAISLYFKGLPNLQMGFPFDSSLPHHVGKQNSDAKDDDNRKGEEEGKKIGTIWRDKNHIEEIGRINFLQDPKSGSKTLIFYLESLINSPEEEMPSLKEGQFTLNANMDVHRNGNKFASRSITICPIEDEDDKKTNFSFCRVQENKISVKRFAGIPSYLFRGEYGVEGILELIVGSKKLNIGFLKAKLVIV